MTNNPESSVMPYRKHINKITSIHNRIKDYDENHTSMGINPLLNLLKEEEKWLKSYLASNQKLQSQIVKSKKFDINTISNLPDEINKYILDFLPETQMIEIKKSCIKTPFFEWDKIIQIGFMINYRIIHHPYKNPEELKVMYMKQSKECIKNIFYEYIQNKKFSSHRRKMSWRDNTRGRYMILKRQEILNKQLQGYGRVLTSTANMPLDFNHIYKLNYDEGNI